MAGFKLLETGTYPLIVHGAGKGHSSDCFRQLENSLFANLPTKTGQCGDITLLTWKGGKYENQDTLLERVSRYYDFPLLILKDWPVGANFWEGTRTKISQALSAINSGLVKTKYVMWLDVSDVLLLDHPSNILEKYLEKFPEKLVWNAERNHYPKDERFDSVNLDGMIRKKYHEDVYLHDVSKDYTTYKYMNAGAAIGETLQLKRFLEYAVNAPLCGFNHRPNLCDQLILRLAQSDNRNYVVVDDMCELFTCFWKGRTALTHPELEGMPPAEHILKDIELLEN